MVRNNFAQNISGFTIILKRLPCQILESGLIIDMCEISYGEKIENPSTSSLDERYIREDTK